MSSSQLHPRQIGCPLASITERAALHGRYELGEVLGQGGMSTVYRARDRLRGADVALKLLVLDSALGWQAFKAEFQILSRVFHPQLVEVYDFGRVRGSERTTAYYTARLVDGRPIDAWSCGPPWQSLRAALGDGLRALGRLHAEGLRHGDFTPSNLLVDGHGRATLIDLGCSAVASGAAAAGTPGYIAPELISGRAGDLRSDLFAVGMTMRRLQELAGGFPPQVSRLVERLVQPDPAQRPADVTEVLLALGEPVDATPVIPRRPPELLGRRAVLSAWQQLLAALSQQRAGPKVLLLEGPRGSGRTRVLSECKWLAQVSCRAVQGDARAPDGVHALLRCALDAPSLPGDLTAVWQARAAWQPNAEPVILVLDDVQELVASQRALLVTLLAALQPEDPVGVLIAGSALDLPSLACVERMELAPLTRDELRSWVGPHGSQVFWDDLERTTEGLPGRVASVLAQVRLGNENVRELAAASCGRSGEFGLPAELPESARRALAVCIGLDGEIDLELVRALVGDERVWETLHQLGCVVRDHETFRLTHAWNENQLREWLGEVNCRTLHRELAECLGQRHPNRVAEQARQWALAGDPGQAERLLMQHRAEFAQATPAYRRAAVLLVKARATPAATLMAAELAELAGDPRQALELCESCLAHALAPDQMAQVEFRAGSSLYRLGDGSASLLRLGRALELTEAPEQRAMVADLMCRAYIQRGEHGVARALAQQAADWTHDPATLGALDEDLGVAASYLGQDELARRHLGRAFERRGEAAPPHVWVRLHSYRAIHEYRTGHYDAAERDYRAALQLAQQHSLTDQAASCALNLGGLQARRGSWSDALHNYERGQALAAAVTKVRTSVAIKYNLAQLFCDLGSFERAANLLVATRQQAEEAGLSSFVALCPMLAGEIALRRGRLPVAREQFQMARVGLAASGAQRELAEVELHTTETELAGGELDAAQEHLIAAHELIQATSAEDLRTRWELLRARVLLGHAETAAAVSLLETALLRAEHTGETALLAELESWLAHALEQRGARWAARPYRERALARWDRCAVDLPAVWHDQFWSHPVRAGLRTWAEQSRSDSQPSDSERVRKLERLLGVYRRLGASLDANDVVEYAMDAAIELTGAERGFLLVRERNGCGRRRTAAGAPGTTEVVPFRVAVARNLDRETIGRSALKVSHSIAQRVIETGTPILTAEAQSDQRFSEQRSVLALGLQAVLCVPVPAPAGTLGALYVDNRFQRGCFTDSHQELLQAFADQLGIALTNARLHQELGRRTRELQKERQRIQELLDARSREVERLSEQVRQTQAALEVRSPPSGMVGRSPGMQHVFAVIERVAQSTFTVLIEGESGTGKELVARAIHT
ncbi:GAF domain-containing protein, partial [Myxococcota bacterium]